MNRIISESLALILGDTKLDETQIFTFFGDGVGDVERYSHKVTKEALDKYIEQCNEQIELANIYRRTFK
jgi:hypothetical protein